jgi:hypothetical protein
VKKLPSWFSISGGLYVTVNTVLWGAIIKLYFYVRSLPSKPIVPDYFDYKDAATIMLRKNVEHLGAAMGIVMPIAGFIALLATPALFDLPFRTPLPKPRSRRLLWWIGYFMSWSAIIALMVTFNRMPLLIYEDS